MVTYNPTILKKDADRLYFRANMMIVLATLIGGGLGAGAGYWLAGPAQLDPTMCAGFGGLPLGALGFMVGTEWAFLLKLKAQTALCQDEIEVNTRVAAVQRNGA